MLGHHIMLQQQNLIRQQHHAMSSSSTSPGLPAGAAAFPGMMAFPGMGGGLPGLIEMPTAGGAGGSGGGGGFGAPSPLVKLEMMDAMGNGGSGGGYGALNPASGSGGGGMGCGSLSSMQPGALQPGVYGNRGSDGLGATGVDGLGATGIVDPAFDERDHSALAAMFNDLYHRDDLGGGGWVIGVVRASMYFSAQQ